MLVAVALIPTKGLTLPFVSYGGSSMLVSCAAIGMLLNISRHASWDTARAALPIIDTMNAAPVVEKVRPRFQVDTGRLGRVMAHFKKRRAQRIEDVLPTREVER